MVARIWAKRSAFVREYSRNICCEFYSNNWDGSTDTAVWTINFNFSSEHAVVHWICTNNKSIFFHIFHQQSKCFNHECHMPIAHSVFKQTVLNVSAHLLQQHTIEICCKMIQSPYQWTHEANHSVLATKQTFSSTWCWPALACVFDSVPVCIPHMTIYWHIHMGNLLLFVHQNRRLATCSFGKMYF